MLSARDTGGSREAGVELGRTLLHTLLWFLSIIEKSLQQQTAPTGSQLLLLAAEGVSLIWKSGVTSALIIIGKKDNGSQFVSVLSSIAAQVCSFSLFPCSRFCRSLESSRVTNSWSPESDVEQL